MDAKKKKEALLRTLKKCSWERMTMDKENHQRLAADQQGQIECKYYRSTEGCKYGNDCRYRHSNVDYVLAPLEVNSLALPVQVYYLSLGGCKYGKACRYSHSKEKSRYLEKTELPPPELNFLGLQIRTLEKECPYYMRTGSCAYGSNCRFNHPDPTAAKGSGTFGSDPSGFGDHSPRNYNAYAQGMHANSDWNGHQALAGLCWFKLLRILDARGSEIDDAELSDCTLMALRYHELADQRKGGN
ncbi:putative Zinc finger family protein [Hibiscus syriacus]|uniref:Zinc finger family protein n=1 Tax=Hibiscus syriacus TaxID=106335 RepID=A0A6A2ZYK5_HIBSY|nr:putative Zinc finger family protein [Hibiscus syriacus]